MGHIKGRRAVVISSDQSLRIAILSILKRRGYEVYDAAEPFSCPIYLDCQCPCPTEHACTNVIITDALLPKMTGLEFIRSQRGKGCKVQNIGVMSAVWRETDLALFEDLGCKIFTKPFKMDELTQWLDECEKTEPNFKLSDLPSRGLSTSL
ncbi:MAG: hypothetical protein ACE5G1_11530 [bacterium]